MAGRWRKTKRRVMRALPLALLTLLVLVAGTATRFVDPGPLRQVRNMVFDEFQRQHPRPYDPAGPVRVVAIDEASLERLGQWPWPRSLIADITDRLTQMGAAAIAFDVLFSEPDRMSPEALADLLPEGPARVALLESLAGTVGNDLAFSEALLRTNSILSVALNRTRPRADGDAPSEADRLFAEPKAGFAFAGDPPHPFIAHFEGVTGPIATLSEAAAGLGAVNWLPDRDQVVRSVPLVVRLNDDVLVPGLAAEALRVAQGASTLIVRATNASGQGAFGEATGINAVKIGGIVVPTDASGAVRVHYAEDAPQRSIPAWRVAEGAISPDEIAGRIILIGATAPGLYDLRATPLEAATPGVEVHAQLLEHVIDGASLTRPDWTVGLELIAFWALTLIFAFAAALLTPLKSIILGLVTLSVTVAASYYAFLDKGLLIDPSFPVIGSGFALLAATGWVAVREQAERRWVRGAFSRYVASDLVETLAQNPDALTLGGQMRPMTILFMDVRSFTSISETMDAQKLTGFLNDLLTPLTDVILSHRGTVDKYMGDAIMAFWNAPLDDPDHEAHACEAALAMADAADAFNARFAGDYPPVAIGIGMNSGECCVGNLGSTRRFDYSVIGDDVNVASRLEAQTKGYGVTIVVGPSTAEVAMPRGYRCLSIDKIRVKGKEQALEVFALIGGPNHPVPEKTEAAIPTLERAIAAFRAGDTELLDAELDALEAYDHPFHAIAALYNQRLIDMRAGVAVLDEDGAVTLLTKGSEAIAGTARTGKMDRDALAPDPIAPAAQ